ncbi:MAG: DUF47 family protein [Clostridia bacterium]
MFMTSKREEVFFDMFVETADIICQAAELLEDLMLDYTNVLEKVAKIEEKEHECDSIVHAILEQLNKAFITPIDREDIYLIAKEMDNITDSIEATAHRFKMMNVKEIRPDALELSKLILPCTLELKGVMTELKFMKTSKSLQKRIIEVNRIEDEADEYFRNGVTNLFKCESNSIEVIIWKEIFEYLENTFDMCEDVANIVEGVVMKHA